VDAPEVYNLPPDPCTPTKKAPEAWRNVVVATAVMALGAVAAVVSGRRS
jgi:hypothetical protein